MFGCYQLLQGCWFHAASWFLLPKISICYFFSIHLFISRCFFMILCAFALSKAVGGGLLWSFLDWYVTSALLLVACVLLLFCSLLPILLNSKLLEDLGCLIHLFGYGLLYFIALLFCSHGLLLCYGSYFLRSFCCRILSYGFLQQILEFTASTLFWFSFDAAFYAFSSDSVLCTLFISTRIQCLSSISFSLYTCTDVYSFALCFWSFGLLLFSLVHILEILVYNLLGCIYVSTYEARWPYFVIRIFVSLPCFYQIK